MQVLLLVNTLDYCHHWESRVKASARAVSKAGSVHDLKMCLGPLYGSVFVVLLFTQVVAIPHLLCIAVATAH